MNRAVLLVAVVALALLGLAGVFGYALAKAIADEVLP